jgi:hypothetical protein
MQQIKQIDLRYIPFLLHDSEKTFEALTKQSLFPKELNYYEKVLQSLFVNILKANKITAEATTRAALYLLKDISNDKEDIRNLAESIRTTIKENIGTEIKYAGRISANSLLIPNITISKVNNFLNITLHSNFFTVSNRENSSILENIFKDLLAAAITSKYSMVNKINFISLDPLTKLLTNNQYNFNHILYNKTNQTIELVNRIFKDKTQTESLLFKHLPLEELPYVSNLNNI